MNSSFDNGIRLKLLKLLQDKPELTQREMNSMMGISLGKINYCISVFVRKGLIKVGRFKKATNKSAYVYQLTPKGMDEITRLTLSYLKIKLNKYNQIKMEIKILSEQINEIDPELHKDPELMEILQNLN